MKFLCAVLFLWMVGPFYTWGQPKSHVLFVNGYKLLDGQTQKPEKLIKIRKKYWYWHKLDQLFLEKMKPDHYYYADGSFPVKTSNHHSVFRYFKSYFAVHLLLKKEKNKSKYDVLNSHSNQEGFNKREEAGRLAGKRFLEMLGQSDAKKDTLHIVCHSMGYAYSLGIIKELKDQINFGKIYIIAPENACAGIADWTAFQEVWQFGSNLDQRDVDPVWKQDGIAPQTAVNGMNQVKKGGRVFFPATNSAGFVKSHVPQSYKWILDLPAVWE